MTNTGCADMVLLLQADLDGELDVGSVAMEAAHVAHCANCAARQVRMGNLSVRLRTELPYSTAPPHLRRAIVAAIAASTPMSVRPLRAAARRRWLPFGASFAIAAGLALVFVLPRGSDVADSVVASHIRALQPGHLMDVVSTDQHTVKPWFAGKLDFAPPVIDLAAGGFPLAGGRLDYLVGRPVAVLAYGRGQHVIDLYVWPSSSHIDAQPGSGERIGYNYLRWTQDDMVFWGVSDLATGELSEFVGQWRAAQVESLSPRQVAPP